MSIITTLKSLKWWQTALIIVGLFIVIGVIATPAEDTAKASKKAKTSTEEPVVKEEKKPKIEILQTTEKGDSFSRTVYVRAKNNTNKLCSYCEFNVTYFDANGKIVGTGMGNTTNFAAGSERTIECIALEIEGAAKFEVQQGTVMFD